MSLNPFEKSLEAQETKLENVGTFRNKNIDFNCLFFHVIQRAYRRWNILNSDTAWYYHTLIESECSKYKVLPICQVIMPNHVHEIFYSKDVRNITNLRRVVCSQTTLFMNRNRINDGKKPLDHLFERGPRYVAITGRNHLLMTMKYIADNDLYLKQEGRTAPYSCFTYWDRQKYKPFAVESVANLFRINPEKLTHLLSEDSTKVREFAESFCSNPETVLEDRELFFKS